MNEELSEIAGGSPAYARVLEESLKRLAEGVGGQALAEMARDVLDGRVGLRRAVADGYYAAALTERMFEFTDWYAGLSDEEREQHAREAEAELDRFLAEEEEAAGKSHP